MDKPLAKANEFQQKCDDYTRWICDTVIREGFSGVRGCVHGIMVTERLYGATTGKATALRKKSAKG